MKAVFMAIVGFVLTVLLMGGTIVGGGVAPGNTSETILTIRHAAIGAQGTVRMVSPDGMYLLASEVKQGYWGFVALSGCKDCIWGFATLQKAANMVSPLSWNNLYSELLKSGWKEITAQQLPDGIKNIAATPRFSDFLKYFVGCINGTGLGVLTRRINRKRAK